MLDTKKCLKIRAMTVSLIVVPLPRYTMTEVRHTTTACFSEDVKLYPTLLGFVWVITFENNVVVLAMP